MNRNKIRNLWWVQALIIGVPFGVVMGLFAAHRGHGAGVADGLINGTVSGALFGLFMSRVTGRQRVAREQRTAALTGGLTPERRDVAVRAVRRGPVPDDPPTRAATAALARYQLGQFARQRNTNLAIFSAFGALSLALALTTSPWWLLALLMWAALFMAQWQQPRTLRRRLALLDPADSHQ